MKTTDDQMRAKYCKAEDQRIEAFAKFNRIVKLIASWKANDKISSIATIERIDELALEGRELTT
jgi:hypothetical protein